MLPMEHIQGALTKFENTNNSVCVWSFYDFSPVLLETLNQRKALETYLFETPCIIRVDKLFLAMASYG